MTTQRIKDLFTRNYGLGECPKMPKFKKHGFLVWLLFFWLIIPIRLIRKSIALAAVNGWKNSIAARANELAPEYQDMVYKTIEEENSGWTEEELKQFDKWATKLEKDSHQALSKSFMLTIYKSKLFKKALDKSGYEIDQIKETPPTFVWGYDFNKGFWRKTNANEYISSIVAYQFFFFTANQLIVINLNKNFYQETENNTVEEFYYKHVAGIKVIEDVTVKDGEEGEEKVEISDTRIVINAAGDKTFLSVDTKTSKAEDVVKAIKAALNEKAAN